MPVFARRREWATVRGWGLVSVFALLTQTLLCGATLVHRPYLQNARVDSITVVWSARENQSGTVLYGTERGYGLSAAASVRAFQPAVTGQSFTFYQYRAELTGLSPGTEYFYRVAMNGDAQSSDDQSRFRTPGPGPFTFLVLGDNGAGTAGQTALALRMVEEKPDLMVHVGDIAYEDGTYAQYQAYFFEYYWTLMRRACFFTVPGNHEYNTGNGAPYLALMANPTDSVPPQDAGRYYSFDWADAHFIGLDSNLLSDAAPTARMLAWLEEDLRRMHARWRIAFFHHAPYPLTHHATDPICTAARQLIVPLLERHGVQLVLVGHEHNYQRTKPMRGGSVANGGLATIYVTTGGGGAGLHPVEPRDHLVRQESTYEYLRVEATSTYMTIHAINTEGKELDKLTLALPSLPSSNAVVNAASFTTAVAPGSLVSIFGEGLAGDTAEAASLPLPRVLAGSTASIDDVSLPLIYASPTQINAQLPVDVQGPATLWITTPSGAGETRLEIAETAPAIFISGVAHLSGSIVNAAAPARAGENLVVYMTGLGRVEGDLAPGQPAPAAPLLRVRAPVSVLFSEFRVTPQFAGLTPGLVGVYQVNATVPADLTSRTYTLRVSSGGTMSNAVELPVQGH